MRSAKKIVGETFAPKKKCPPKDEAVSFLGRQRSSIRMNLGTLRHTFMPLKVSIIEITNVFQLLNKYVDTTKQCIESDYKEKSAATLDQYLAYLKKLQTCGKKDPCKVRDCVTKSKYESWKPSMHVKQVGLR